jgi:hypothetical protein
MTPTISLREARKAAVVRRILWPITKTFSSKFHGGVEQTCLHADSQMYRPTPPFQRTLHLCPQVATETALLFEVVLGVVGTMMMTLVMMMMMMEEVVER